MHRRVPRVLADMCILQAGRVQGLTAMSAQQEGQWENEGCDCQDPRDLEQIHV